MNLTVSELLRKLISNFLYNTDLCFGDIEIPVVQNYANMRQVRTGEKNTNDNNNHFIQEQEPVSSSYVKSDGTFYFKDFLNLDKMGISKNFAEGFGNLVGALVLLSIIGGK